MMGGGPWGIVRGSKNFDAAETLLAFLRQPERQCAALNETSYGNVLSVDPYPDCLTDFAKTWGPQYDGVAGITLAEFFAENDARRVSADRLADIPLILMERLREETLAPKSGSAFELLAGDHLRITDIEGQQVVNLVAFNLHNFGEVLSTSYSRARQPPKDSGTYFALDHLTEGHVLVSTISEPLMSIVADTQQPKGVHAIVGRIVTGRSMSCMDFRPRMVASNRWRPPSLRTG